MSVGQSVGGRADIIVQHTYVSVHNVLLNFMLEEMEKNSSPLPLECVFIACGWQAMEENFLELLWRTRNEKEIVDDFLSLFVVFFHSQIFFLFLYLFLYLCCHVFPLCFACHSMSGDEDPNEASERERERNETITLKTFPSSVFVREQMKRRFWRFQFQNFWSCELN